MPKAPFRCVNSRTYYLGDVVKTTESPDVFLSYSHDSDAHKNWVRHLADDLVKRGVKTRFDQWDLLLGDDIGKFMEQSLNAKYVVLVCTELFSQRANNRIGGVGYEQAVFIGELLVRQELESRFLPILRSGDPSKALPIYLRSRLFVDFRDESAYGLALEQLLRRVFDAPEFTPPRLGPVPDYVSATNHIEACSKTKEPQCII